MRQTIVWTLALALVVTAVPAMATWEEGVAAFTKKDYQTAASHFQELVDQNPDGYRGHYMLGLSLQQMGQRESAMSHLRKAYDLNPNDLSIKLALGRAYKNLRRYGEVAQLLSSVDASSLPAAQQAAFYQMRGEARFKTGDEGSAVQDFQQLARLQPNNAQVQYLYGTTALSQGQTDAGIDALDKANRLDPSNGDVTRAYAQALIKKGRLTRDKTAKRTAYLRAADLAKTLVSQADNFDNNMLLISAELGAGQYGAAVATGQKCVAKNGSDWLAHYYLGQAYSSNGQYTEAEAPLLAAKERASASDLNLVWSMLGFIYEKQKKYTQSIAAYQSAGDSAGVARVQDNERTARENEQIEAENARIREMEEEARKLEEELQALEGGGGR